MLVQRPESDMQHKVVLLGDSRVGKTSLLNRQLHGYQPPNQNPTIGCHCNELTMDVDDKTVTLQVWDTAGQEMYRALVPVYMKGAHAAIVLYDVTDLDSFHSLERWFDVLRDTISETTPVFLVGNKIDLLNSTLSQDQLISSTDSHSNISIDDNSNNCNNTDNNNNNNSIGYSNDNSNALSNINANNQAKNANGINAVVDDETAQSFAKSHNAQLFKASALSGTGVDAIFRAVAKEMAKAAMTDASPRDALQPSKEENECC